MVAGTSIGGIIATGLAHRHFLTLAGICEASTSLGVVWLGLGPTRFASARRSHYD
jgi:hypothetical protein